MTERRLGDRVKEHIPKNLNRVSRSSITDHILQTGHTCKAEDCFSIIYRARNKNLLRFAEAVAIRMYKPDLNVMKDHDLGLQLPWY